MIGAETAKFKREFFDFKIAYYIEERTRLSYEKIVMTGGGTAGHVTPNIALMPALKENGYEISYIGSYAGMEKQLIEEQNIPYYGISSEN